MMISCAIGRIGFGVCEVSSANRLSIGSTSGAGPRY
jgi:hypothetical protein